MTAANQGASSRNGHCHRSGDLVGKGQSSLSRVAGQQNLSDCLCTVIAVIMFSSIVWSPAGFGPRTDPFLLYTADLLQLIKCHQLHPHAYADDTQIYGFCHPHETDVLQLLSACIDDVSLWMTSNRLQLNPTKTEILWCASARRQQQIPVGPMRIGDTAVSPSQQSATLEFTLTPTCP